MPDMNDPTGLPLRYAAVKLGVVLGLSCPLSLLFTALSRHAIAQVKVQFASDLPAPHYAVRQVRAGFFRTTCRSASARPR